MDIRTILTVLLILLSVSLVFSAVGLVRAIRRYIDVKNKRT
jgi:ABC-type antimicrobial peptide transport system permease subunit